MNTGRPSPCPHFAALFAVLVGASACATAGSSAPGQPPGEPPAAEPPSFLTLALETAKELYVLGEPVYLTARFKNSGTEPLPAAPNLDPEFGELTLTVASGGRKPFLFVPLGILDSETPPKTLPAGAEVASVFPIFFGGRGWTFAEPGQYTLTMAVPVRLHEQRRPVLIRSKPVTITVEPGAGAEPGRLLMAGPQGDEAGRFLTWNSGDHLRTGIGRMFDVMEKYPQSPLVDYLALALGVNWSRPFKDYSIPRLRPADCRTAADYLGRIRASLPPVLEIERRLAEARCAAVGNDPSATRRALDAARRLIGTGTEFQPFSEQAARIEAGDK